MKIAVCIATYNGERYIKDQLDSIACQTIKPDLVVISDDNSCDETFNICKKYKLLNIHLVKNNFRKGYSGNFKSALINLPDDIDIVFFSDQDDVWFPHKIELHIDLYNMNTDFECIYNDVSIVNEFLEGRFISKMFNTLLETSDIKYYVMGCACSFKFQIIKDFINYDPEIVTHDNYVSYFFNKRDSVFYSNVVLQYYRRHEKNTSNVLSNKIGYINIFDKIFNYLKMINFYSYLKRKRKILKMRKYLKSLDF